MHIKHEVVIDDLNKIEYTFWIVLDHAYDFDAVLDRFEIRKRESKRHSWKVIKFYDRLQNRSSTLLESEVEVTDEIERAVKDELIAMIENVQFKKWSQAKRN